MDLLVGYRSVFNSARDDEKLALFQTDLPVAQFQATTIRHHEE